MTTRRQFLACLAAAPLAAQVERLERRGPAQKILVLGAGLAGLCAACELRQQGHDVTLLEAQPRPGGRVRTLREGFAPGLYIEAGPENIPAVHHLTRHYAGVSGLTLLPQGVPDTRPVFYHLRDRRIFPDDAAAVWPLDLTPAEKALGYAGLRHKFMDAAIEQALAAGYSQRPVQALRAFDAQKPGPWLRSLGASPAAAELLTVGFGTDFGSAASLLLHRLNSMGGALTYRVEGGNERLPIALSRGLSIRYATPVVAVTQDDRSVAVTVRAAGAAETLTADRVVCTLPCPVIGRIFDGARLSAARSAATRDLFYSRTVKIFLQSRTRFWLRDKLSGAAITDLPIERLTPDPGADPDARGILSAYVIAGYTAELERMNEEQRVDAAFSQARRIFPELGQCFEGGHSYSWGLDRWAGGSFALHVPGQIAFIETLARPEGRIHFAGEHTSQWTGWMQGAFDSARRVVNEINR